MSVNKQIDIAGNVGVGDVPNPPFGEVPSPPKQMIIASAELTVKQIGELVRGLNAATLPSVSLEEIKRLPRAPGIYFIFCDARLVYIGQTWDLYLRWRNHKHLAALREPNTRLTYLLVPVRRARAQIELALIYHHRPSLNKQSKYSKVKP